MERLERIASHAGTVKAVASGSVEVVIESTSACASCAAHAKCGFAESKNKTVAIPTDDWQQYHEGDTVTVHIDESRGMLAVWIAYVLPAVIMLAAIAIMTLLGSPEWAVALAALAVLAIYVGLLYILRRRIGRRFTLTVSKC